MAIPSSSNHAAAGVRTISKTRPVVLEVPLTPDQCYAILRYTGKSVTKMEFTEQGLWFLAQNDPNPTNITY